MLTFYIQAWSLSEKLLKPLFPYFVFTGLLLVFLILSLTIYRWQEKKRYESGTSNSGAD